MFPLSGINFCIQEHFCKIPDIRNKKFLIIETFWPQINSCYQEFLKQYVLQDQVLLPLRKVIPKASYLCAIFNQHGGQACRDVSRHKPLSKTHSCWLVFCEGFCATAFLQLQVQQFWLYVHVCYRICNADRQAVHRIFSSAFWSRVALAKPSWRFFQSFESEACLKDWSRQARLFWVDDETLLFTAKCEINRPISGSPMLFGWRLLWNSIYFLIQWI